MENSCHGYQTTSGHEISMFGTILIETTSELVWGQDVVKRMFKITNIKQVGAPN